MITRTEPRDDRGNTGRPRMAEVIFRRQPCPCCGEPADETETVLLVLRGEYTAGDDFAREAEKGFRASKGPLFREENWHLDRVVEWVSPNPNDPCHFERPGGEPEARPLIEDDKP